MPKVNIIGGGLAGSEAAWQLAKRGIDVKLYEMRGPKKTAVHKTDKLAELVCSNSFRGTDVTRNAVAVLHDELRALDSLIIKTADKHRVPAGGALAIDREIFAQEITDTIQNHPHIEVIREEITELPKDIPTLVATGPLTSSALANHILELTGEDKLSFFDAVAPIVAADSIDMTKAWEQSRYDKGDGSDYINCPLSKEQYYAFIEALLEADQAENHNPEDNYFDGCLPIEVIAERGVESLRYGPMKPVGLTNKHDPEHKPYGIVQLRQENKMKTLYNIVGFQTRLKWGDQKRVFSMIPGLENAEFERMGVIHKNIFINSPALLDGHLRLKKQPNIYFAGQVTGVEGYVESTAMGALAGLMIEADLTGKAIPAPPPTTMMGALVNHITGGADAKTFQPMNVTYGLLQPFPERVRKKERKPAYGVRAQADFKEWSATIQ
jgi:methylenetetrahydrofolate--tRNA-(uracil-5-)-methyltransferase